MWLISIMTFVCNKSHVGRETGRGCATDIKCSRTPDWRLNIVIVKTPMKTGNHKKRSVGWDCRYWEHWQGKRSWNPNLISDPQIEGRDVYSGASGEGQRDATLILHHFLPQIDTAAFSPRLPGWRNCPSERGLCKTISPLASASHK